MKYEISREVFKQRLNEKLNFAFIDVQSKVVVPFEGTNHMPYGQDFVGQFSGKFPAKSQNVIVYALNPADEAPVKAAEDLANAGYQFVYFYRGSDKDLVLDKGLN
ncbi:MAG: hypothetical protein K2P81_14230 [Bacteriovoracaceae bacterium]|jgi:hypothetical protein|nr:hypothetical protein [Bacteriovoracaceae bacterium]